MEQLAGVADLNEVVHVLERKRELADTLRERIEQTDARLVVLKQVHARLEADHALAKFGDLPNHELNEDLTKTQRALDAAESGPPPPPPRTQHRHGGRQRDGSPV